MKLGIIKKDKSKIEITGDIIIIEKGSNFITAEATSHDGEETEELSIYIDKIQLIYLGGWK